MSPERLDRIEERVAWLERHLTEQDKAMLALHEEQTRLRRELLALHARTADRDDPVSTPSPTDERPPHY